MAKLRAAQKKITVQEYVSRLIQQDAASIAHIMDEDEDTEAPIAR